MICACPKTRPLKPFGSACAGLSRPLKKCIVGGNPKFPSMVGAHGRAPALGVAQPPPVAVPPPRACVCGARRQAAELHFFNGLLRSCHVLRYGSLLEKNLIFHPRKPPRHTSNRMSRKRLTIGSRRGRLSVAAVGANGGP